MRVSVGLLVCFVYMCVCVCTHCSIFFLYQKWQRSSSWDGRDALCQMQSRQKQTEVTDGMMCCFRTRAGPPWGVRAQVMWRGPDLMSGNRQERGGTPSIIIIISSCRYQEGLRGAAGLCGADDPTAWWQSQANKADICGVGERKCKQWNTLLALRIWNMRGRPCVMSSSVYSSSSMQLNSLRRPWIRGRRCWWKHVRRDSIQVCKVQGTPEKSMQIHTEHVEDTQTQKLHTCVDVF